MQFRGMTLNTKIRLTVLCLSGFELYSRWVPLHRYVIEYILDKRYSELCHFVDHMYSSYIKLIGEIENEAKTDRKALLTMRWTNSLDTVLESDVCQSVYAGLPGNYSTPRIIRTVTGIIQSLVYDFIT